MRWWQRWLACLVFLLCFLRVQLPLPVPLLPVPVLFLPLVQLLLPSRRHWKSSRHLLPPFLIRAP